VDNRDRSSKEGDSVNPPPIMPPMIPPPPPTRFVKRGGYMVCLDCNYALEYCGCGARSMDAGVGPPTSGEAESSLAKRIAEVRTRAGGR
jgi:hypothetical protein